MKENFSKDYLEKEIAFLQQSPSFFAQMKRKGLAEEKFVVAGRNADGSIEISNGHSVFVVETDTHGVLGYPPLGVRISPEKSAYIQSQAYLLTEKDGKITLDFLINDQDILKYEKVERLFEWLLTALNLRCSPAESLISLVHYQRSIPIGKLRQVQHEFSWCLSVVNKENVPLFLIANIDSARIDLIPPANILDQIQKVTRDFISFSEYHLRSKDNDYIIDLVRKPWRQDFGGVNHYVS